METVSFQRISDANPTHIITACEDTDTCPGCGAGYRVGISACEYCRRPVRFATGGLLPSAKKLIGESADGRLALVHRGEAIIPRAVLLPAETEAYYAQLFEEEFAASLQRLADKAQMVHRDDGTTGFTFG